MPKYKHLFFDLDHTLWDFERNSSESLTDIYHGFELINHGVMSLGDFVRAFLEINTKLWDDFDHGRIAHSYIREHRFRLVFEALNVKNVAFGSALGEEYLKLLPQKSHLLDGAVELLEYCASKDYQLHIVTNGFDSIQASKMQSSGIHHYFQQVVTNEKAGAKKPDAQIFAYALQAADAQPHESLMIGDNWQADILGALRFGMDAAFYNPKKLVFDQQPTYDVQHLDELKSVL
ncbi:YjjG family noncanonical pyrimidine nucleotidase [Runella aurantiaca]|uniref:Noncanonical pyrimidine nucleotidase, YjjG family n=1 Tax=Runella aurantiaca TaxID=2282308 RepID=A0A369I550_9BACT|nr:YjjG family noncanonical pyrimidine nucleotidase [Runella aurantiaca]RDB04172.1 noncanonical pyrimidine nucleotidase, YjjG family [Runella aurantiaca]